jgi:Tfp pilus assembly protein PilF
MAMGVLRRVQICLSEAQIQFETTIALDRNEVMAYTNLGQVFLHQGQPDAAIGPIQTAIRLSPTIRFSLFSIITWAHATSSWVR